MRGIKLTAAILLLICLIAGLSGCGRIVEDAPTQLSYYSTVFPLHALTQKLTEDIPEISAHCLIQPQDGCWRSYAFSDWDLYTLAYGADVVVSCGRGLESFSSELQAQADTRYVLIEALYGLDLLGNDAGSDEYESHFDGPNPHLYMSAHGAMHIAESLAASLSTIDAAHADVYNGKLDQVLNQLNEVAEEAEACRASCAGRPCAVMNESLMYTAEECGLDVSVIVRRESGEMLGSDALDKCIANLKAAEITGVLIERQAPRALIEALTEAGFDVVRLDTMTTQAADADAWDVYIGALSSNIRIIAEHAAAWSH